ncbi:MAG: peptide deformylase [Zoogloeaceae bacterium]|jgi:peptide deformylase|nr:peptide deformylase [Zoogloeaceae bacterium]
MSLLKILHYPDPRLKKIASPVTQFDAVLHTLIADMAETMYAAPGIGLAATQVDQHRRIVVIDVSEERNSLLVLINAKIVQKAGTQVYEEGCLSVPGIYEKVERAEEITVEYLDLTGNAQILTARGLLAVCIQHELDHLEGRVFVDYLSQLKQSRIKTRLAKQAKANL